MCRHFPALGYLLLYLAHNLPDIHIIRGRDTVCDQTKLITVVRTLLDEEEYVHKGKRICDAWTIQIWYVAVQYNVSDT